jgi:hypothetical protein
MANAMSPRKPSALEVAFAVARCIESRTIALRAHGDKGSAAKDPPMET